MNATGTGTVYGLRDPRDSTTRYVGETTRTLPTRLSGHLSGGHSLRVRAWIKELRNAGLKPEIYPIREGVPARELLAVEREEITRIIFAGGTLLNDHGTGHGHKLIRERQHAEQVAAEREAWRQLAGIAMEALGGPIPPPRNQHFDIPNECWEVMSKIPPGHKTWEEDPRIRQASYCEREYVGKQLRAHAYGVWGELPDLGDSIFAERLELELSIASSVGHVNREDASRHLALIPWYVVAVHPWWHLADLGGLAEDDAAFIVWAGRNIPTRKALGFLGSTFAGALAHTSKVCRPPHESPRAIGPGHRLATVAAAYSGITPPEAVQDAVKTVLGKYAEHHMLTQPMADLFLLLDPRALDSVYGKDIASEIDRDLGLPAGTSGCVLRTLVERTGPPQDRDIRHAAARSAQAFPVRPLPDYGWGWVGPNVPVARMISASVVRAGLAKPAEMSPKRYVAEVCALWTPQPVPTELRESA